MMRNKKTKIQKDNTKSKLTTETENSNTMTTTRRICLFGTSANPPTGFGGHAGVIKALVDLKKFDEVRILPVYRHTFASKRDQLLGYDHRVNMCQLLVEGLSSATTKVMVSRAEEDSFRRMLQVSKATTDEEKAALRVGTADLLEMLMKTEAATEFSFCLGADTFLDLTNWKWKRSRDVLKLLDGRLVVVNRKQQERADDDNKNRLQDRIDEINATSLGNGNVFLLDVPSLQDVSSSKVRNAENKSDVKDVLSPKVLDYVVANKLYGFETSDSKKGCIIG